MNAIEKLKISREIDALRKELAQEQGLVKRLGLSRQIDALRKKLGAQSAPEPEPPAPQDQESPGAATLRAVVQGKHDSQGALGLYSTIKAAVDQLVEAAQLDAAQDLAKEAIEHWARLDLETNG